MCSRDRLEQVRSCLGEEGLDRACDMFKSRGEGRMNWQSSTDIYKRCLLLGRKVTTNLDSILKSRDITLPTKVHLVKAMVFPVVMHGCESWTIKKAEC